MHSHIHRSIRGIEVNDETINYEAITGAVLGTGHFLGDDVTMAAMQRDYFYPSIADRDPPISWAERGAPDIWQIAKDRAKEILDSHYPMYLPTSIEEDIKRHYNIFI